MRVRDKPTLSRIYTLQTHDYAAVLSQISYRYWKGSLCVTYTLHMVGVLILGVPTVYRMVGTKIVSRWSETRHWRLLYMSSMKEDHGKHMSSMKEDHGKPRTRTRRPTSRTSSRTSTGPAPFRQISGGSGPPRESSHERIALEDLAAVGSRESCWPQRSG